MWNGWQRTSVEGERRNHTWILPFPQEVDRLRVRDRIGKKHLPWESRICLACHHSPSSPASQRKGGPQRGVETEAGHRDRGAASSRESSMHAGPSAPTFQRPWAHSTPQPRGSCLFCLVWSKLQTGCFWPRHLPCGIEPIVRSNLFFLSSDWLW